jgi:hypothetical protein
MSNDGNFNRIASIYSLGDFCMKNALNVSHWHSSAMMYAEWCNAVNPHCNVDVWKVVSAYHLEGCPPTYVRASSRNQANPHDTAEQKNPCGKLHV